MHIIQLPKVSTRKSPTSNILLRNVDTKKLRNLEHWAKYVNSFRRSEN